MSNGFNTVTARDYRGEVLRKPFILRGGPGHLANPKGGARQPSYFTVEVNGHLFELHNSLEFIGSSGAEHEVDVSAVDARDAERARKNSSRIMTGPPLIGVELKELGASAYLDKNVVRAFFGIIVDFIPTWAIRWMSLGVGDVFTRDFVQDRRSDERFWVLTTAKVSEPSERFARAQEINVVSQLDASSLADATGTMAGRLHMLGSLASPGPEERPPKASRRRNLRAYPPIRRA